MAGGFRSIQPTYEELKRDHDTIGRLVDGRIQPTYEELKQTGDLSNWSPGFGYPAYL